MGDSHDIRIKSQPITAVTEQTSQIHYQQSSFPAILTNPKLTQLRGEYINNTHKSKSDGYIGKRRRYIQERDSTLTSRAKGAERDDASAPVHSYKSTFPSPLPPSLLPRNQPVPSSTTARGRSQRKSPAAGDEGSFYVSLKGIRKTLAPRGTGSARARFVVQATESEIRHWILGVNSHVVVNPDDNIHSRGRVIDATTTCHANGHFHEDNEECIELPSIIELSRSSSSLVWLIPEKFERFVVHCVARWWGVVSFSKSNSDGERVTHLLKPRLPLDKQIKHDDLDTPPTSEVDSASEVASEVASEAASDAASDLNMTPSEAEENVADHRDASASAAWADITDDLHNRVNIQDKLISDDESSPRDRISRSASTPDRSSRAVRDSDTEESDVERTSPSISRTSTPRKLTPKPATTHPWKQPTVSFAEYLFESG
ncbi:hypothetical protein E3P86_02305 [Wallemia ichthyophaga]|uniref:Uncharacterized protein n=1 Tax=Wallemia ichthyophaga TaxID=245174 RepID=A0A4T0JAA0_WALIC|nr:hypothetical protein E3P86_02305 [Wallemia ichthyophaga]